MVQPGAAVVVPHLRITWGGSIGNPAVDQWSNGLAWQLGPEAMSANELQVAADGCGIALNDWITSAGASIGSAVLLEWVKAVWVLSTGKNRDVNTAVFELNSPNARGNNPVNPSWNQAYAVTLRTALSRGRGHAGRIYPPLSGKNPAGTTPYLAEADANAMASAFATCIVAMRTAIGNAQNPPNSRPATPVVVSRLTQDGRAPILTPITGCVVDRVADVIHARTNQVPRAEGARVAV